jgi:outer membrane lipoprotein SlyB
MKLNNLAILVLLAGISLPAAAGVDTDAVVGGALGGAAGAAVGSAVGGRDAAIVGGGIGGALGTAIATKDKKEVRVQNEVRVQKEVVYVREGDGRHDNGLHRGHYKKKHKHRRHDHDD